MHTENPTREHTRQPSRETVISICPTGVLETTVIMPSRPRSLPPLLALHGISRNADELARAFAPAAEATGRIMVVPYFSSENWPVFQRMTRRARPDKALLALLGTLRAMDAAFRGSIDVFGFSGGAQLAHRFAMVYPEAVGDLHLGAAGWYTLPEENQPYPYGILESSARLEPWPRLMRSGLRRYLQRRIAVYVGAEDTQRDESLRRNQLLDDQQGAHRLERARRFVASINARQATLNLPCTAHLTILPDCDHSFLTCAEHGGLALRVCEQH